ncbi:MAG: hypothetical protein RRB13_05065 [bacterium]|nr:hypothetical protein [bacterium]
MARASLLLLVWLLAACSAAPFKPATPAQLEGLHALDVTEIPFDLLIRCRLQLKGPEQTHSGDCRLWVGDQQVRFEASHPLTGLLLSVDAGPRRVVVFDGQSGSRREVDRSQLDYPLLGMEPGVLKALLLGRQIGAQERPQSFRWEGDGMPLVGEYKYWTYSQGVAHPKVIEARQGDYRIKLVLLDLQLGR